jgi:hypothetical protein
VVLCIESISVRQIHRRYGHGRLDFIAHV